MALIGKVRGMRMRDGKSISEISRLTSLSRNTIKKWLQTAQGAAPKYRRRDVSTKLAPFVATLTQALEVDARRTKHERRTARALHVQLTSQGYEGGYTRLTVSVPRTTPLRRRRRRVEVGSRRRLRRVPCLARRRRRLAASCAAAVARGRVLQRGQTLEYILDIRAP